MAQRELAAATRAHAAEQKATEADRLQRALRAILDLHRADFPAAQRPVASAPPPVDVAAYHALHEQRAKAATSVTDRAARRAALEFGAACAETETTAVTHLQHVQIRYEQQVLDDYWGRLSRNHPETVLATLAGAFEDNEAAAAAVGIEGGEATLLVVLPPTSAIPDRQPATTAAGNLTLKKLTKRDLADYYTLLVCGHVLVTVKEALAVAPALASVRVVGARPSAPDAYGVIRPEVLVAARLERTALDGIRWSEADAVRVVNDASTERILRQRGATQELVPVSLADQPELQELVDTLEFETLLA